MCFYGCQRRSSTIGTYWVPASSNYLGHTYAHMIWETVSECCLVIKLDERKTFNVVDHASPSVWLAVPWLIYYHLADLLSITSLSLLNISNITSEIDYFIQLRLRPFTWRPLKQHLVKMFIHSFVFSTVFFCWIERLYCEFLGNIQLLYMLRDLRHTLAVSYSISANSL